MRSWLEQLHCDTQTVLREIQEIIENYIDFQRGRHVQGHELKDTQGVCEIFFQYLSDVDDQFNQLHINRMTTLMCTLDNFPEYVINTWWTDVLRFMQELLKSTLIFEEQPPTIIRKDKKFHAKVRWLIGSKIETFANIDQLTGIATILNNEMVKNVKQGVCSEQSVSKIQNGMAKFEINQNGEVSAKLRECKIMLINRNGSKDSDKKIHEKFAVLFRTRIVWNNTAIDIPLLSLPLCLATHVHQDENLHAMLMWDYAFAAKDRLAFEVPDTVQWFQLAEILSRMWNNSIGSHLTDAHLKYLYHKIFFNTNPAEAEDPGQFVTWDQIARANLPGQNFTFWSWFYGAMKLIEDKFKDYWNAGYICGYISRNQARIQLESQPAGTFLFRFSNSSNGKLAIDVRTTDDVLSYGPFKFKSISREMGERSLNNFIRDCEELNFLYPNLPVSDVFPRSFARVRGYSLGYRDFKRNYTLK
ncbi:signal transducer and activator of transcription 5B-like isoform X2 [Lutzomyia longipalpis]|nr:signal transducer and activator of transcription 5B-like isoform X2 [Lutzomyia longipalpis]